IEPPQAVDLDCPRPGLDELTRWPHPETQHQLLDVWDVYPGAQSFGEHRVHDLVHPTEKDVRTIDTPECQRFSKQGVRSSVLPFMQCDVGLRQQNRRAIGGEVRSFRLAPGLT